MVNDYKKIVLLSGLKGISDHNFKIVKSLLSKELKLNRKAQYGYDRIKIADLMEDKFPKDAGIDTLIELYKEIPELEDLADKLKREKAKGNMGTPWMPILSSTSPTSCYLCVVFITDMAFHSVWFGVYRMTTFHMTSILITYKTSFWKRILFGGLNIFEGIRANKSWKRQDLLLLYKDEKTIK